jgi:hypothetical protein
MPLNGMRMVIDDELVGRWKEIVMIDSYFGYDAIFHGFPTLT